MTTSKRFLSLLLACLFCLGSLASCSGGNVPADDTTPSDTTLPEDTTAPVEDEKWPEIEGTVIYVDAAAEDGGDGTEEAPFKSIPEAQAKIREIKNGEGLPEGGITVLLASGNYPLMDTITFTSEDSGAEGSPITYMAAKKNEATLNGGVTLAASDFVPLTDEEKAIINDEAARDKVVKVDLSGYGFTTETIGKLYSQGNSSLGSRYEGGSGIGPAEFYVDGNRMSLSRYPNASAEDPYLRTGSTDKVTKFDILSIFEFEAPAMAIKERGINWNLDDLWAFGYFCQDWSDASVPVAEMNIETLSVTLAQEQYYGIRTTKRFCFFNILAETDEPGEYYIDRENLVLYFYPTEDFENSEITMSLSVNNMVNAKELSYVTFSGINFTSTRAHGLVLSSTDHITIEDCKIYDISRDAINLSGTNALIQNNEIYQIGYNAINISGGVIETLTESGHMIYNNKIHDWGQICKTYMHAVDIRGCGTTVSHNEFYNAPHTAIRYVGPKNIIEYNEIYNVCMDSGDCGAIYAMRSFDHYGSIIRYNLIHDIGRQGTAALGIYWDDGLSGQTAYGNIIVNTSSDGMNIGGGRDNVIENNLFINWVFSNYAIQYDTRARDYADDIGSGQEEQTVNMANRLAELQKQQEWLDAFPGYGDIIPYTYDYSGDRDDPRLSCNAAHSTVRNNIACQVRDVASSRYYFAEWISEEDLQGIYENNMEIHDPDHTLIPGYENGDFTIAEDSEVFANGFVRIPIEEIGRVTND
ncbi:MAG: right-handed parallel beta-helix repeat-containing protein [Clostridia bacterium]|nr:right-handed parallel beta-helix repeat-containing protein [Clostridia bacterium]